MTYILEERKQWRQWVTPKHLRSKPIHNWFVFPHSFTSELVHELIGEWQIRGEDRILDPFSGAGTTVLSAREKAVSATGVDLSPLAVLATKCKVAQYGLNDLRRLEKAKAQINENAAIAASSRKPAEHPKLIHDALPEDHISVFDHLSEQVQALSLDEPTRNFFLLALLSILPQYSRAVAAGGWLRFVEKDTQASTIPAAFLETLERMLKDLKETSLPTGKVWEGVLSDARQLTFPDDTFSAVISSPPYPNRHDYSRVFGVELMFHFLDWEQTRQLRYQLFHSHVEAKPTRREIDGYTPPDALRTCVETLQERSCGRSKKDEKSIDVRVVRMVSGYFLDMFLCLKEMKRVCKPGARIALVVGNVQYTGEAVLVDEWTAAVAEQAGLTCEKLIVARHRGNSAQQMGEHGVKPSRETVVVLRKPNY